MGSKLHPDSLTITLSDKDGKVSVEALTKALGEMLVFLRGVQASFVGSDGVVQWDIVRATMKSPFRVTVAPTVRVKGRARPQIARRVMRSAFSCAAGIERGTTLPVVLSDDALDAARKLVRSTANDGMQVTLGTQVKGEKVTFTGKAIQHIDEMSAKARLYLDFATIEGILDVVSVRGHKSFFVTEVLTNHKVECLGSDEQFSEALSLIGKRVAITGRVKYRNHVPQAVHVEEKIRTLREASALPQPSDIGPIDITGGLSSEEFIRKVRNA